MKWVVQERWMNEMKTENKILCLITAQNWLESAPHVLCFCMNTITLSK